MSILAVAASTSCFSLFSFADSSPSFSPSSSLFHFHTRQRILSSAHKKPIISTRKPFQKPSSQRTNKEEIQIEIVSQKRYSKSAKDDRGYLPSDGVKGETTRSPSTVSKSLGVQKKDKGLVYDLKEQQAWPLEFSAYS
eukprot:TRINITY_DN2965_c0_g1_i5.p2 TRINITY_DN2965_c0_g1~~TRINITY_DN2965_c0_g1_i5.p2  ORF type:complete len:138 (-),score=36.60 TRINITY_DN2965_c0_g1_i5:2099-2512(-)